MDHLTDRDLIEALLQRLDFNRRALGTLEKVNEKLEATNRKLQESEALKGHFLSNIRNEINNPLAAIMGLAAQIGSDCGGEHAAQVAGLIYAEAYTLDFQLENIFVAAELEAGAAVPSPALADAAAIVAEVSGQMQHRGAARKVILRCGGERNLPFVTDPRMLQLMVRNLVANAVEFSPDGGTVETVVLGEADGVRISVGDSGPGIDQAERDRIFDRFWQLEAGSTKSHRGHGLGLSVTRALAELMGGRVVLESAAGAGSTFTLLLPELASPVEGIAPQGNAVIFDAFECF